MPFKRTPVKLFQLGNPLYASAVVTFFAIDGGGNPTTTPIPLYTTASGATQGANPQTLDSNGRLTFALWHDQPFVAKIGTAVVPAHQTAPWYPDNEGFFQGNWVTATLYYVGDTVRDTGIGNIYECAIQHVASVLATDIAAGDWTLVLDMATANADAATATAGANTATAGAATATSEAGLAHADRLAADASAAAAAASAAALPTVGINNVAAAATTDIGSSNYTLTQITGTATITALGTAAAGIIRDVRVTGSPVFINNASIVIPSGFNLPASPNDHLRFVSSGAGVWELEAYFPASAGRDGLVTANGTTAAVGNRYDIDSSSGALTQITLPAAPNTGDTLFFRDLGGALAAYPVTLLHNGNNIYSPAAGTGIADDLLLTIPYSETHLMFRGATLGWEAQVA